MLNLDAQLYASREVLNGRRELTNEHPMFVQLEIHSLESNARRKFAPPPSKATAVLT